LSQLSRSLCAILACLFLAGCMGIGNDGGSSGPAAAAAGTLAGPQGAEEGAGRKQLWLIPSPQSGRMMRATLYRPAGDGPFPLAIVNHGSDQDIHARARMGMPQFETITNWLVARGYAVLLPQRPGHGETGGSYLEDQGNCAAPNYIGAGERTADSIEAAIAFMTTQPFIKPKGVIVVGHSAGAWGGLALAARNPKNVSAIVNFAGGRGGRNRGQADANCAPDRLVAAAGTFGRTARIPTLWLYAENDSYFPPPLARRMADAYMAAGGKAEFRLLRRLGEEGHFYIKGEGEQAGWAAPLGTFLTQNARVAQR
jgi:dienelactone hydrolase